MLKSPLLTFLENYHQPTSDDFATTIGMLEEVSQNGSTCLDLSSHASLIKSLYAGEDGSSVGLANDYRPLILHNQQLYLHRYFSYESIVLEKLLALAAQPSLDIPSEIKQEISSLNVNTISPDQVKAIECALSQQLCIITGGPGTGKTTTVIQILNYLHQQNAYTSAEQVMIFAPTGKAADRLRQSIAGGIERLKLNPENIPSNTSTIHRGLGYISKSIDFRHHVDNPLPAKIVIIDETSMIDLPLMAKLLQALAPGTRLIMLGDENQLASVEIGSVLADIILNKEKQGHPLANNIVNLVTRFRTQGAIQLVCDSINQGDSEQALSQIENSKPQEKGHINLSQPNGSLVDTLEPFVCQHWLPILQQSASPKEILSEIEKFRILCPTHRGHQGIEAVNRAVEFILSKHGLNTQTPHYHGRSVIIRSNNPELELFNGDTGVCIRKESTEQAHFATLDGTKSFHPSLLPEHDTAWALTIHKTQGSEYEHVLILLPDQKESDFVTKELLYTAISRAKNTATIWGKASVFTHCINTTTNRASGLSQRLWGPPPEIIREQLTLFQ